jgi:hypothetical protein
MSNCRERQQDAEGDPIASLDRRRLPERGNQGDRCQDDHELEPGCLPAEPGVE